MDAAYLYILAVGDISQCTGPDQGISHGFANYVIGSFLLLFVKFYMDTYKKPQAGGTGSQAGFQKTE